MFIYFLFLFTKKFSLISHSLVMGTPFFDADWEKLDTEVLARTRIRVVAFIEATTDARVRMQLQSAFKALEPLQDAIRALNRHLLVSFSLRCCRNLLKSYSHLVR